MLNELSILRPLRQTTFRRIWTSNQISTFGGLVQGVGAAWMMTSLTSSPSMIALVQGFATFPVMLFALIAGALADSFDRRAIMIVAQSFMLLVSTILALAAYTNQLAPWSLLVFTFSIGLGTALNNPSFQASLGDIVPREDLPEAVLLNGIGFNLMRSVGPAIGGGVIVATLGAAAAFTVNALSYVPLLVVLLAWKRKPKVDTMPREAFGAAVTAGLRYVAMSPNILRVILRGLLFGFGAIGALALLPLVARDLLHGAAPTYGVLLGCFGCGAVGGGLINTFVRRRFSNELLARGAFLGSSMAALILALGQSLWLSVPALLLAGASWVLALSLFNAIVQLSSPRWVVGRTLAMYQMATFGGMALGSWVWGAVTSSLGIETALLTAAVCLFAGCILGMRFELPNFTNANLDPQGQFKEPALELDLNRQSGPIMVMIDYVIDQTDVANFLAAMTDRRRIRRRDGARQWVLLRDLEHSDQWTESYHVATWNDYLRHNMRRTKADADVAERLRGLHRGAQPPLVHRMIERQSAFRHDDIPLKNIIDEG